MRLLRSVLLKLVRRPVSAITLGVMLGLITLIYIMLGASLGAIADPAQREALASVFTFPEAYGALASLLLTFAILAAAAYAGSLAGGEWTWGAFRVAIARGESRTRYVLLNFAAVAGLILIGFVLLFVAGTAMGLLVGGLAGVERGDPMAPAGLASLPGVLLSGWWVVVMAAAIAYAVAFALRSAVAGLVVVVALYFAEQMAAVIVPADFLQYAPISAGTQLLRAASEVGPAGAPVMPLLITAAYIALALCALLVSARRVEAA